MLKKYFKRKDESGLTIVEIIVAASMMALVLSASALALATGFGTAEFSAKRAQAAQFAQQTISIAKQAPFAKVVLGLDEATLTQPAGVNRVSPSVCNTIAGKGTGNTIPTSAPANLVKANGFPGLVYCQTFTIKGVKTISNGVISEGVSPGTYTIMTNITQVATGGLDSTQAGNSALPVSGFVPRRITVTVWWGDAYEQKIVSSYVRTPSLAECIPAGVAEAASPTIASCNWGG